MMSCVVCSCLIQPFLSIISAQIYKKYHNKA